ncbi:energy-coupling factor transporter ATPase [Paenibacillus sp. Marseille-Q4541]|uniref:ABC transporter ATP-binding protein n=1 Tax=Paenibacillus sp. Marseille-Q4541 TaxID=2831522 RepID=UPI001BAD78E9|nr:energy-coupling factor transporter ATPase [Paenibacillus sp. Marseille-Q4541]
MREPLIELTQVSFTYPGSDTPVLNDVSLTLHRGDFTAIIGSNGSGKSTLCKLFNGLIPHYYSGDYFGVTKVCGQLSETSSVAELSKRVGYVYQDFENQLVRPTVFDDVVFTPLNYGYADYQTRGQKALMMMGLSQVKDEFIWSLSGGQKHLLALAGALAMDPDILVIDEPISQLDPQHARHIYDILKRLNEEYGKTIIVIEHHAEFIADYCKEVVLMDQGHVEWKRPTREALSSVETLLRLGIYPPQVTQAAWLDLKSREQLKIEGTLLPIRMSEAEHWFHSRTYSMTNQNEQGPQRSSTPDSQKTLVVAEDIRLSYRTIQKKMHPVLDGVNLTLQSGEAVAIIGNNGAGKSSLLKLIAGIVKPTGGYMNVNGYSLKGMTPERMAGHVTYVYQNPEEMFIEDSVQKEVGYYVRAHRLPDASERINKVLESFRLTGLKDRDARLLSGGQQRRVALAIGAAIEPSIMLLDEPTANLDIATKQEMLSVLSTLKSHVETVVIATHDMQLVAEWASRIIVMHQGKVIADGTKEQIFEDMKLLERAGLLPTQLMELSRSLGLPRICYTLDDFMEFYKPIEDEDSQREGEGSSWTSSKRHLTVSP